MEWLNIRHILVKAGEHVLVALIMIALAGFVAFFKAPRGKILDLVLHWHNSEAMVVSLSQGPAEHHIHSRTGDVFLILRPKPDAKGIFYQVKWGNWGSEGFEFLKGGDPEATYYGGVILHLIKASRENALPLLLTTDGSVEVVPSPRSEAELTMPFTHAHMPDTVTSLTNELPRSNGQEVTILGSRFKLIHL